MINIGLTTFADHPDLSVDGKKQAKLSEYSGHFPVVEMDTPFYAIPKTSVIEHWQHQAPDNFQFILKANQLMTLHDIAKGESVTEDEREKSFREYLKSVKPLIKANQLKTVLFQFPPTFQLNTESIEYLRLIKSRMGQLSVSVEFRDDSWYADNVKGDVKNYLTELNFTFVTPDEPHTLNVGVPFEPVVTSSSLAFLRLHGRNVKGWTNSSSNWRTERTLYNYSEDELMEIAAMAKQLADQVAEVVVIFNNNAGHDAAKNALRLKKILNIEYNGLAPLQMDLF
ncbi:DUF72 domain-containing protein [Lentilactobacillus sp. SPB1-3]|uniref:DUF72 domain-containing protein n=1 Tax=Lentilactobacillus terminaliae TaxID=3003483 RepID=A0ACD5DG22_9LACO|nr:DUF72 domain-containing protein [Lentilactobacillus sp. SPB1-3]MCZ0977946.1 DUF72 domain-containing protein [Lentilactobacillus sp. SPB1-3]